MTMLTFWGDGSGDLPKDELKLCYCLVKIAINLLMAWMQLGISFPPGITIKKARSGFCDVRLQRPAEAF